MQRSESLVLRYVNVSGRQEGPHDSIHMHAAGVVSGNPRKWLDVTHDAKAIIGLE
jgi:hypothetical protein